VILNLVIGGSASEPELEMPKFSIKYSQDINTVYRFVTDADTIKKRGEALGEKNVHVEVDEAGGTKTITSTRDVETNLPSYAKKLFNPINTVAEGLEWRDAGDKKTCKNHLNLVGSPGQIDAVHLALLLEGIEIKALRRSPRHKPSSPDSQS
jgi:hypothetical protein